MDRQHLEALSFEELQAEAIRYRLTPKPSRPGLIDQIMSHLERHGSLIDMRDKQLVRDSTVPTDNVLPQSSDSRNDVCNIGSAGSSVFPANSVTSQSPADSGLQAVVALMAEQLRQNSDILRQFMTMSINNGSRNSDVSSQSDNQRSASSVQDSVRVPAMASVSTAQAIQLLASQIPEFRGTEEEEVEMWIDKIEKVSRIHGVSNDVMLLAASSKLSKAARRWFDLSTGSANESWQEFKRQIINRFKRSIPHYILMQRVDARRWNPVKETFTDYANDKLALLCRLRLSERDQIYHLINGIGSVSLRNVAASLRVDTVDQFLQEMHRITIMSGDVIKRQSPTFKSDKHKSKVHSDSPSKSGEPPKQNKDIFCVYCKNKGHVRSECLKLKRKEQSQQTSSSSVIAAVNAATQPPADDSSSSSSSLVACLIPKTPKTLEITDPHIKVL